MTDNIGLLKKLSLAFGPSGCEDEVRELILCSLPEGVKADVDAIGNLTVTVEGRNTDRRVTVSAHMDEVGFMVNEIKADGTLGFSDVGGIDESVLIGKRLLLGKDKIGAIISSMPYHLVPKQERQKLPSHSSMYLDIGAKDKEDAEKYVKLGDCAVFDSDFVLLGDKIKGKALDDRAGAFIMLNIINRMAKEDIHPAYTTVFAFTVREEVGSSGAAALAYNEEPNCSFVLETTATGDVHGAPDYKRVAPQGMGGAVSAIDRATIYPKNFVNYALSSAKEAGAKAQIKKYVSGGNDSAHISKSRDGVPVIALSIPTRYLHSPACVLDRSDLENTEKHLFYMLCDDKLKEVMK